MLRNKRIAILGASRGLGKATVELLKEHNELLLISRKSELSHDFSKEDEWPQIIQEVHDFDADVLIYTAGGGPFGPYQDKEWKDHKWAFKVNFEFPAYLILRLMNEPAAIKHLLFVGSAIAENSPDIGGASYSAAKHALRGLVSTLQEENKCPFKLHLFSPGYIDTEMLPKNAWPRQHAADTIRPPNEVAKSLVSLVVDHGK